jgi:hypothetical protein
MTGDRAGMFGPIYLPALQRIRTLWLDLEPLVADTRYDDRVSPTELRIELVEGVGATDTARLDVQWSERGMYGFHYTDDDGTDWRFDRHRNTHSAEKHFHPPPDAVADDAEPSCITVEEVSPVTRAVHALWRAAYDHDDLDRLNSRSNRP